jgi:PTH2 family peptidyl-tRNA hydrolase
MKQAIVVRTDLNMRKGKMCAQAAHASMAFMLRAIDLKGQFHMIHTVTFLSAEQRAWLEGAQRIVVLQAADEEQLKSLEADAVIAGVKAYPFRDAGFTEVQPNTLTALAIGPDLDEKIDAICGKLRLL